MHLKEIIVLSALLLPLFSACSNRENVSPIPSISGEAKRELDSPVNCKTAKSDIRILEEERASVAKQILSGARAVFPFAAAAGILTGDYNDRVQVATGQYNADIEAKIAQIKRRCGIK